MWRVIKSTKRFGNKGKPHKLVKGDIIKLGRYIFEVKDISSKEEKDNNQSLDNTEIDYKQPFKDERSSIVPRMTSVNTAIDYQMLEREMNQRSDEEDQGLPVNASGSQASKGDMVCRICLSEDSDMENPLISPCKCSGTMKFIHLDCLKEWLNSK